jgi:hypothetical protein
MWPTWSTGYNNLWLAGIGKVREVYKGMLGHNIQAWWLQEGLDNCLRMEFLKAVDVIVFSLWAAASKIPFDVREAAIDIWWTKERNYPADFLQVYQKFGKKIYFNSGYQNGQGQILSPWAPPRPGTPMSPEEQLIGWKAALQAMRYQVWCAGYDMERYNENQTSHPPPYVTASWRYHPENRDAIIAELNKTLTLQLPIEETATLTINVQPPEGGTTSPEPGSHTYTKGTEVSILAAPAAGYTFDHWAIDGVYAGKANPIKVTMDTNHMLTAYFLPTKLRRVGILALWPFPICRRWPNIPPCPTILEWAKRMGYLPEES